MSTTVAVTITSRVISTEVDQWKRCSPWPPPRTPGNVTARPPSAVGTASTTSGTRMVAGLSWTSWGPAPKKTSSHARNEYATVNAAVATIEATSSQATHGQTSRPCTASSQAAWMIASLLKNPARGATPASAPKPRVIVTKVSGTLPRSPPITSIDVAPPTACTTDPAARNSSALNAPCASRCRIAADQAPAARAPNMYASWLTVDQASTRLRSWVTIA